MLPQRLESMGRSPPCLEPFCADEARPAIEGARLVLARGAQHRQSQQHLAAPARGQRSARARRGSDEASAEHSRSSRQPDFAQRPDHDWLRLLCPELDPEPIVPQHPLSRAKPRFGQPLAPHLAEDAEAARARLEPAAAERMGLAGIRRARRQADLPAWRAGRASRRRPPHRSTATARGARSRAAPLRAPRDRSLRSPPRSSRYSPRGSSCADFVERLARAPQAPRRQRQRLGREPERRECVGAATHPRALEARIADCSGRRRTRCRPPQAWRRGAPSAHRAAAEHGDPRPCASLGDRRQAVETAAALEPHQEGLGLIVQMMRGDERRNVVGMAIGGHEIVPRGAGSAPEDRAGRAASLLPGEDGMGQAERRRHAPDQFRLPARRRREARDRP